MFYCKVLLASVILAASDADSGPLAWTESGWVRGAWRAAQNEAPYASFRGVPYAKQPVAELRFQELQLVEAWDGILDATTEGPVCYQHNVFFGTLMAPQGVSESCIHTNVHVPSHALPTPGQILRSEGLPIVVFMHGGGWLAGSGDSDIYGPDNLVCKDMIVITFNYRLDVLGFLSLGTSKIPGNNGIRDALTLLRWVQRNAPYFGGNPNEVTLAGQSAGSSSAHLISLSPISKGLFKRLWLMSGTAIPSYYTTSPAYAQQMSAAFLTILGLNGTDYDSVHDRLVQMPINELYNASYQLTRHAFFTFLPVQESVLPGVTNIIADDPVTLLSNGYGDDIPLVVGFTSSECESFRPRVIDIDVVGQYLANPLTAVNPHSLFTLPYNETKVIAERIAERYYGAEPTIDKYIKLCSDSLFAYPTLKFIRDRSARGGTPVYLYKFSYEAEQSIIKLAFDLEFSGAAHIEDTFNIFKVNSFSVPRNAADDSMRKWMSHLFANFVHTGFPLRDHYWPAQNSSELRYQELSAPYQTHYKKLSDEDQDVLNFFDELQNEGGTSPN